MRRALFILVALAAAAAPAKAQQNWLPSWTLSTEIWSKYVGGPHGAVPYKHPVLETNIAASWNNCLFVNLWFSKALGSGSARGNGGNEVDYTVGCAGPLGNGFGGMVSFNYYDLSAPTSFTSSRGDFVQIVAELNYTLTFHEHTLVPHVRVEPSWVVGGIARDGVYYYVGVRHQWQITDYLSVVDAFRLVYDPSGVYNLDPGWNARFDLSLAWKVGGGFTLRAPAMKAFFPLSQFKDGRKDEFVIGAGLDKSF